MSPGTDVAETIPGSSMPGPIPSKVPRGVTPTFSFLGKVAMKMAGQIAEEWIVGPIVASHLTTGGRKSLIQPYYESTLPYQHISPFLSDIDEVQEPFRQEFSAIVETEVHGGADIVGSPDFEVQFKSAFSRRKKKEDETPEDRGPGLFQRFIERRRYVKGDRIGKPLSKFIDVAGDEVKEIVEEPGAWRLVGLEGAPGGCFFFSRSGARELFKEVYDPPTVKGLMAVTLSQVAVLDASATLHGANRSTKSRGIDKKVLALASEMAEKVALSDGQPCQCCWTVDLGGLDAD